MVRRYSWTSFSAAAVKAVPICWLRRWASRRRGDRGDADLAELGFDEHGGLVGAAVTVGAIFKRGETKSVFVGDEVAGLLGDHRFHRGLGEIAAAIEFAAVEDHLAELGAVGGDGEEAAGGKRFAAAVGEGVFELRESRLFQAGLGFVGLIDGGEAGRAALRSARRWCRSCRAA